MASVNTSHYSIFEYWKDKFLKENGSIDSDGDYSEMVVRDWGEPCCWGCGKPIVSKKEEYYQRDGDYKHLWNDTHGKLERCHIVPGSIGGKDEPQNLFLLCPQCHFLSPDSTNRRSFFRWVYNNRKHSLMGNMHIDDMFGLIDIELKRRGIQDGIMGAMETLHIYGITDFSDMKKYISEHAGLHNTTCADSTTIAVSADYLCHLIVDRGLVL